MDKGNHSVHSIQFNYVACVKYRRKVLTDNIPDRLKAINLDVAKSFGMEIIEQETAIDHIHILFASKPLWSPSYFPASTGQVTLEDLNRYVENQNL